MARPYFESGIFQTIWPLLKRIEKAIAKVYLIEENHETDLQVSDCKTNNLRRSPYLGLNVGNGRIMSKRRKSKGKKKHRNHVWKTNLQKKCKERHKKRKQNKNVFLLKENHETDHQVSDCKTNNLRRSPYLGLNVRNRRIMSKMRKSNRKKKRRNHVWITNLSKKCEGRHKKRKQNKNIFLLKDLFLTRNNNKEKTGFHFMLSSKVKLEIPLESSTLQVAEKDQKVISLNQDSKQQERLSDSNISWIFSLRKPQNENEEVATFPIFQQRVDYILNRYFSPTPPTKQETMAYEILRLCTLHDFPMSVGQSCIRLAQAGLYYEGADDKVTCFSCLIEIGNWLREHVPMDRHRQLSPNCKFIQCSNSGNVALSLAPSQSEESTGLGASGESAAKLNTIHPQALTVEKQGGASKLGSSDAGYSSASSVPSHERISAVSSGISVGKGSNSSDSGFVSQNSSVGKSSTVNSVSSGNSSVANTTTSSGTGSKSSGSASVADTTTSSGSSSKSSGSSSVANPTSSERSSMSSGSASVANPATSSGYQSSIVSQPSQPNNSASTLTRDSGYQSGSASQPSVSGNSSSTPTTASTATVDTQSDTSYRITAQNKSRAHYPEYVLKTDRLRSFANWPDYVQQTPEIMAESGFYFAGYEDCVRCFQCGIGLRNWEPPDNPHVEHARWSPRCAFLLSVKGQDFINMVLDAVAQLASRENSERTAASGNSSSSSNEASSASTNQQNGGTGNDVTDPKSAVNEASSQPANTTSKTAGKDVATGNFMDTAVAKNVIKFGYSKTDIQEAVQSIVNENDWKNVTQENILKYLTDKKTPKTRESNGKLLGGSASSGHMTLPPEITELKNKNREMREMTICKICLEEEVSIVFLPCGHLVACAQCAPALTRCAVCRKPITGTICAHLDV